MACEQRINPSILSADFCNLQQELEAIASADLVHVDVMDNHFVPNLTIGEPVVRRIQQVSPLPLDIHLMIANADTTALPYAELGAYSVTFHAEAANNPVATARAIRERGARAGLAIKPGTAINPYLEILHEFDQLLVMTVEPGFGGQSFMTDMMPKLEQAATFKKKNRLNVWLQVDGGITAQTIEIAAASGADTFVAGTAVFGGIPEQRITQLREAAAKHAHTKKSAHNSTPATPPALAKPLR